MKATMKISEVQIVPVKPSDGLVAFGSIVIDESIYLGSIGIHVRPDGSYRITYPSKRIGNRELSVYHPINKNAGLLIEKIITEKCEEILEGSNDDRYNKANSQNE